MWHWAKNLAFLVLVPGTVGYYLPVRVIARTALGDIRWGATSPAGLLLLCAGWALVLWCHWRFATTGRGTPAPFDPPARLVVRGAYRFVRNPMYLAMMLVNLGWAVLLRSTGIVEYVAVTWVFFHLFVMGVEEPGLRVRFGADYEAYCRAVRRWLPGRGYSPTA